MWMLPICILGITALLLFIVLYSADPQESFNVQHVAQIPNAQIVAHGQGMNMFDQVLYINLDSRPDRKWQIEKELRKLGVPDDKITRVPGVIDKFGSLGCSKAHLNALQIFEDHAEWKQVLIVEDDAMFVQSRAYIDDVLNKFSALNIQWDVLQLLANVQDFKETTLSFLVQIKESQTTAGYAVSRHYLQTLKSNVEQGIALLETKSHSVNEFCIDAFWKPLQKTGKWFHFHPVVGFQRDGFSDIEQRNTNYADKRVLQTKRSSSRYVIVGSEQLSPKHIKHLELLSYSGDETMTQDYHYDILSNRLKVRAKNDEFNNCDKFGKMIRFLSTYLMCNTHIAGAFFTDDTIPGVSTLDEYAHIPYWGQCIDTPKVFTFHNMQFEVPQEMKYCKSFYLSRDTISKVLLRSDLFLPFPLATQLPFHKAMQDSTEVYREVCISYAINVAQALRSSQIFPFDVDEYKK